MIFLGIHRIQNWIQYKKLALQYKPTIIFYSRDPHPLRKPPYGLKLIFYHEFNTYIFQDYADGATCTKLRFPLQTDGQEKYLSHMTLLNTLFTHKSAISRSLQFTSSGVCKNHRTRAFLN